MKVYIYDFGDGGVAMMMEFTTENIIRFIVAMVICLVLANVSTNFVCKHIKNYWDDSENEQEKRHSN